jgi:hypothetical protein
LKTIYNKDNAKYGMLLGFVAPLLFFSAFYLVIFLVGLVFSLQPFIRLHSLILLSIAPNFLLVRGFMSRRKMEHSGGGLVAVTFAYIMFFFLLKSYLLDFRLPGLLS